MKKVTFIIFLVSLTKLVAGQILHPVKWAYAAKRTGKQEVTLLFKATIDEPWHIYSIHRKEGGPLKTSFDFSAASSYTLLGEMKEPTPIRKFEKSFDMDVFYFEKSVVFQQKIKLKTANTTIKGKLNFMVCNDEKCLPPEEVQFKIPVTK